MEILLYIYKQYCKSYSISTDSRSIEGGEVYISLKGDRFDGNVYAANAIEQGAILVVVDDPEYLIKDDNRYILVEDGLLTLQSLARHHRTILNIPVIGLTGSNGKTTTKELIAEGLSVKYKVHATKGNYNNHIGVPLTILSAPVDCQIMIVEMGANHQGEIQSLCSIANPDIGMITNIGRAHLEGFGGYDGVVKAKSEMYESIKSTGGTIVYNNMDKILSSLVGNYLPIVMYNTKIDYKPISGYPHLRYLYRGVDCSSQLVGSVNSINIAAAHAICGLMGCDSDISLQAINDYNPSNNRSELRRINGVNFVLDAYNANPTSMELSITDFAVSGSMNKSLVLGDMLEVG